MPPVPSAIQSTFVVDFQGQLDCTVNVPSPPPTGKLLAGWRDPERAIGQPVLRNRHHLGRDHHAARARHGARIGVGREGDSRIAHHTGRSRGNVQPVRLDRNGRGIVPARAACGLRHLHQARCRLRGDVETGRSDHKRAVLREHRCGKCQSGQEPHRHYVSASRQAFRIATDPGVSPCTQMVSARPSRAKRSACAAAAAGSVISASENLRERSVPSGS